MQAFKFHTSKGLYLNRIDQSTVNIIRRLQRRASLETRKLALAQRVRMTHNLRPAADATKPGAAGVAKKTKKKDRKKRPA
jgi:hypothetical protein